jgi:beta-galactosidase
MNQTCGKDPSGYYNDPNADWFGCNIYVGWYDTKSSNNPTSQINTRLNNTLNRIGKPIAMSEYGCGGTQHCHSDDYMNTTDPGNTARHDIERMMWLHEGHIATIRNFPQLLFASQWQLFDVAVSSRNEGYTECLDGVTATTNDELRRLNNKGLVERDHITKKDPFYLYKAEWNSTDKFVHICCKDYTKTADRVLKCYTNDGDTLSLYEGSNPTPVDRAQVVNHIAQFTSRTFTTGVTYKVSGSQSFDTVTF